MKTVITTFFLLVLSAVAMGQVKNDLLVEGIHGRVSKITETTYSCKVGSANGQSGDAVVTYEEELVRKTVKTYNEKGDCTELTIDSADGNRWVRTIKEQGNSRIGSSTLGRDVSVYDVKGNRTALTEYDNSGKLLGTTAYKYDERNNETEQKNGATVRRHTYRYDRKGWMAEDNEYDGNGALAHKTLYSYNENGIATDIMMRSADDVMLTHIVREPDVQGRIIKTTERTGAGNETTTTTYANFDMHGNWQKQVVVTSRGAYMVERVIEYYK